MVDAADDPEATLELAADEAEETKLLTAALTESAEPAVEPTEPVELVEPVADATLTAVPVAASVVVAEPSIKAPGRPPE